MRKWVFLLGILLFLDAGVIGNMKERICLDELRNVKMPVELFEASGIKREEMERYLVFWKDLKYFPVAFRKDVKSKQFYFQDSWKEVRTFGGDRVHEGCDIFGEENRR